MRYIEESIQIDCITWFGLQYPQYKMLLHHSPNGGRRNKVEGAIFKAMGVRAGFPDLILCMARNGYHGLFIEMKSKEGRQGTTQKEMQTLLEAQGYKYCICRSFFEFKDIILEYLSIN